jgi:hypothetical protein
LQLGQLFLLDSLKFVVRAHVYMDKIRLRLAIILARRYAIIYILSDGHF